MKKIDFSVRFSMAAFLCLCFVGMGIAFWQFYNSQMKDANLRLNKAVSAVEVIISHAKQAAEQAEHFTGTDCSESTLKNIRKIAASIPDVRSVSLMVNNEIYCSSVLGDQSAITYEKDYTDGNLLLMNGNDLTPYRSIIIYRSADLVGNGVLIGIDAYYVYSVLNLLSYGTDIHLQIGEKIMSKSGRVSNASEESITKSKVSNKFSFSASTATYTDEIWSYFIKMERMTIGMILFSSILLSLLFYRYLQFRQTIEFKLRKAIRTGQIFPVVQPIVSAQSGLVVAGEVLLRWTTPEGKSIPPDQFISVAESNGTIKTLTSLAFERVSSSFSASKVDFSHNVTLFFNVSSANFEDDRLLEDCLKANRKVSSSGFCIGLEITERTLIEENESTRYITNSLRKSGIKIALDDFGTGNANYTYIRQFQPNFLKIDKAFTRNIISDNVSRLFVQ
ncbi:TPA: EAL domain-containing protein, partial [Enterobacter asburiae]